MSDQVRSFCEIKEFSKFLQKSLEKRVLNYELKPLTKPGDNYGSTMQSVDVTVAGENDDDKVNEKFIIFCLSKH